MGSCFTREPDVDFSGPVDFNHFHILRAIGKGAFGKVCIVKKKDTKEMYAMKYMNKVQIIRKHAVENVFRESEILRKLEHNFLVNLWFTFQDQEDLFVVLDLMLGGDISYHLEKEGRFSVARVRLYVAELSLALDYLREHKVVHRDVKPANMLLDSGGHVHLTDFNVACVVHSGVAITSVTGTKPYMAPEVLHSRSSGYSYAVDWWGLGVSVYEMLRGQRPFSIDRHMSNEEIVSSIRRTRPSASVRWDHQTCDLLRMLLHPDEDKRLQSVASMKQHRFFQDVNWDEVERKETTPIYIPAQNRIHCDPTHELEEMIVEPNPLHKKQHRLSRRNFRVEDETLAHELEKLARRFPEYNRFRLKEAERRKMSTEVDGGTDSADKGSQSLDQKTKTEVEEQEGAKSSDPTSLSKTPDQQSQTDASNRLTEIDQVVDVMTASDGVLKDTEKQEHEKKSDEPSQQPLIVTREEEEEEKVDERVLEGAKVIAMPLSVKEEEGEGHVAESRLQTETVSAEHGTRSDHNQEPAGGENPTQQVDGQSPEDCLTPSTESSAGSPTQSSRDPPNSVLRTDSMSSGALLLPREL